MNPHAWAEPAFKDSTELLDSGEHSRLLRVSGTFTMGEKEVEAEMKGGRAIRAFRTPWKIQGAYIRLVTELPYSSEK